MQLNLVNTFERGKNNNALDVDNKLFTLSNNNIIRRK